MFINCDFCVLTFEFHFCVFHFVFCVMCFEDCDFLFRRRVKGIYSKCADAEMEKERVQRDKNGSMNNVTFYAVSSSSPYGYYVPNSKHKSQNTRVTSFEHRTQNICIQNTMSHIGYRNTTTLIFCNGISFRSKQTLQTKIRQVINAQITLKVDTLGHITRTLLYKNR